MERSRKQEVQEGWMDERVEGGRERGGEEMSRGSERGSEEGLGKGGKEVARE